MNPASNSSRWNLIQDIFQQALERPPSERAAYLAGVCGDDAELRLEVASLLANDRDTATLHSLLAAELTELAQNASPSEVGLRVGPYRLVRELDGGGMGVVYLGIRSDEHYFQFVAVKMLRRGMESPALVQRFRTERQILATLNHPNIGAILDGGDTQDGRPFIVMEYVEGQPITQACKTRSLAIRERIELFCAVCAAVHYAHQKSVVHRDIKPSNVLVSPDGVVKLIDFGISKPLDPELVFADSHPTESSLRMMTPDYASPEQLLGQKLTTASDLYSLGVLLFELLTDARPYTLRELTPAAAERRVCHEETRKPSSTPGLPARTRRELSGDLDRIILMAMEKDPARRYASAQQLNEDLRRFLEGRPVLARKPTPIYTVGKLLKRHPTASLMTAATLLVIAGSVAYEVGQSHRMESRVGQVARLADAAITDMADKLQKSSASLDVQEALFKSALQNLDQLRQTSGNDPRLLLQLSKAYVRVGDLEGSPFVANLGKLTVGATSYQAALHTALEAHKGLPGDESAVAIAESYQRLGGVESYLGHLQQARENYQQGLAWARGLSPQSAADPAQRKLLATSYAGLGSVQLGALQPDQALESFRAALQVMDERLTGTLDHDRTLSRLYWYLGRALADCCAPTEAVAALRKGIAAAESVVNAFPADEQAQRGLFTVYYFIEAPLAGEETVNVGDVNSAQIFARKALALAQQLVARDSQNALARWDLGFAYEGMGDVFRSTQPEIASGYYRDAIASARRMALESPEGRRPRMLIAAREEELAAVLPARRQAVERLQLLEDANRNWLELTRTGNAEPEDRRRLMRSYCRLGEAELALNHVSRAEERVAAALPFFEEFKVTSQSLTVLRDLGFCYEALGDVRWNLARDPTRSAAARRSARADAHEWYSRSAQAWALWKSRGVATADSEAERHKAERLVQVTT